MVTIFSSYFDETSYPHDEGSGTVGYFLFSLLFAGLEKQKKQMVEWNKIIHHPYLGKESSSVEGHTHGQLVIISAWVLNQAGSCNVKQGSNL